MDRERLITLARRNGMTDAAIARALRVGSVQINGGKHKRTTFEDTAADPLQYEAVATAFLDELAAAGWPVTTMEDIRNRSKLRRYTWPRMVLMHLLRRHLGGAASFPDIAAFCGRSDHTSAMNGHAQAPGLFQKDATLAAAANRALERLKSP